MRYPVQPERPHKSPSRNPERRTKGFFLGDFWGGSGWREYRTSVVFIFILWFIEFTSSSGFIPAFILPFTWGFSPVIYFVLMYISLFISRQSLVIQATTMAMSCDNVWSQCGHVTNRFWIFLDGAKLEEIKTNDLTIIWTWYDHNLLTYFFMPVWCNPLYK